MGEYIVLNIGKVNTKLNPHKAGEAQVFLFLRSDDAGFVGRVLVLDYG